MAHSNGAVRKKCHGIFRLKENAQKTKIQQGSRAAKNPTQLTFMLNVCKCNKNVVVVNVVLVVNVAAAAAAVVVKEENSMWHWRSNATANNGATGRPTTLLL